LSQRKTDGAPSMHLTSSPWLVRAGATFINGKLAERPGDKGREEAA